MQTKKNQGFKIQLSVVAIASIKPRIAGSFETKSGETQNYGYAVKIRCRNVDVVNDDDFGEKEVESTLEIEIPCDTMTETVALNNHLKELKKNGKPFPIPTTLPSKSNDVYACKSFVKGRDFIEQTKK